ncbi:MAG: MFS transporter [Nitrososphaerales archaeon]
MKSLILQTRTFSLPILYLVTFITRVGFGAIVIAFPHYVIADSFMTGVVLSIYPIFEALSAAPVGMYVDRRGRKNMLFFGLMSIAILTFLIGLSRDVLYITVVHGLMGISAAAVIVSTLTMITDLTKISDRGVGMGVFDLANIAGYAGGILIGTWLYTTFETNPSYVFFSVAALLLAVVILVKVLVTEPPHETLRAPLTFNFFKALSWKIKALLPLWFALTTLVGIAFFIPKALTLGGYTITESGLLLFAGAVGMGIGAAFFGRLSDKIGREKTMWIGIAGMLMLLPSLALSLSPDTNPSYPNFGTYLYAIAPSALLTSALVPSILALVGDTARSTLRGSAMGLYSIMLSIGIAAGNLIGGISGQIGGLPTILYAAEGVFISAVIISLLLSRLTNKRELGVNTDPKTIPKILTLSYWMRFIKFNIVGLTGVFVNQGLLILLTTLGLYYLYSAIIAVETSIISNFLLNDLWTFKDRRSGHILKRLVKFNVLMLVGLVINLFVLYTLTDLVSLHYGISNLFGIGVASIARYLMSIKWAWLQPQRRV